MIEFAFPFVFLLLPAPWIVYKLVPPYRQTLPALRFPFFRAMVAATGAEARIGSMVVSRRNIQILTAILVWGLLVIALARPERIGEPIETDKAARDLILAIDISGSMDERDFRTETDEPLQRLAAVREIVGDFIEAREGDRVALIVFGSRAFIQAPFTEDLQAVRALLDQTDVGMAGPHTAIGDAIGLAIRTFEASEIQRRLLILLSDGADTNSRMSPVNAAQIAAQNGVEIHTIAVGDPGGSGENRVDTEALATIAERAGGQSFFANDTAGLSSIYERIDELAPRVVETLSFRPRQPLAHLALSAAAILILLAEIWLLFGSRRRMRA